MVPGDLVNGKLPGEWLRIEVISPPPDGIVMVGRIDGIPVSPFHDYQQGDIIALHFVEGIWEAKGRVFRA